MYIPRVYDTITTDAIITALRSDVSALTELAVALPALMLGCSRCDKQLRGHSWVCSCDWHSRRGREADTIYKESGRREAD